MQDEPSVAEMAGWYPDPVGAYELRYHNGQTWTGDVSSGGVRHVSPIPPAPEAERSGTLALVLGIITLCIGWVPFISVIAFGTGLAAVIVGLRRRHSTKNRSAANLGIVTGAVGLLFAIAGTWLALVIVDAVVEYDDPGPHQVELTTCGEVDGITEARGTLTNLDDRTRSYTIEVTFDGERAESTQLDDVESGTTASFAVEVDLRFDELDCAVTAVNGPRPFGLDVGT